MYSKRLSQNRSILGQFFYYYCRINRQRPYKNYIPGAGCTINLYDKKDRLVLSQSEELRKQGKWLFTKYDHHNRPVLSGTCTGPEAQHRAALQSQTVFGEARGTIAHGYTNNTYPTTVANNDYLTATYYDNYDWQGESQETLSVSAWPDTTFVHTVNNKVAGMVTGSKQKILGIAEDKWLLSASYYDDKYREIQSVRQLYPEGLELIYRSYNYVGNLTRVKELQTIDGRQEGFDRSYTYNIQGYLTEVAQQVLDYGEPLEPVTIAKYTYNDLWQITEKTNHNNIDTTHYGYAIDGRQVSAQSPLFSYKLYFDTKPANLTLHAAPRYDGNVSFMEWKNDNTLRGYRYEYDAMKQLTDAFYMSFDANQWISKAGFGEQGITYDLNGNITKLRRTDALGTDLHNITNIYGGNQLLFSMINGTPNNYIYDGNGNMISNHYKGVSITYNILNLPSKIFAGSEEVSYIYSASGQKLATKVGDSYTYYRGSFVYNDGELDHMIHPEGLIRKASGGYVYYYAKKDHLGSTRVLCHEADGVKQAAQTTDYYPFGLSFRNYGMNYNRYLFSGKELQDQVVNGKTLQLYDFGARNYDPIIGRWFNIDPLASKYYSISPYAYCLNSPIKFIDPDGKEVNLWGIDRYLERDNKLSGGTINNDMMRKIGGFEVSPYQNKAGDIIGWSAFRDGQIQYVMDPEDIDNFTKNVSTFGVAADLFYMNGTPSEGMMKILAGEIGSGLSQEWAEALMNPVYYMYVANALGTAAITAGNATTKIYRVYGGDAGPIGKFWTPINPNKVANYRYSAGLPHGNTGRFVIEATTRNSNIRVTKGGAVGIGINAGGLPEYKLMDPTKININRVSGVNPRF